MSDSEFENFSPAQNSAKVKKATPAKRKSPGDLLPKQKSKKLNVDSLFGLHTDDETRAALKPSPVSLPSYLAKRVSAGTLRRSAPTDGNYYIEVKVYQRSDAESAAPEERWKKALLRLSCLLDEDTSQWKLLQRLVRDISVLFDHTEPTLT